MMLDIIKNLLLKIIDDIDQGNSNMTAEECHEIIDTLNRVTNKNEKFSKYQACNLDAEGEEYQYLTGEVGQKMFKIAKRFLCDDCRSKYLLIANRL